jgi:DNA-binding MarR family transcriptional regulator
VLTDLDCACATARQVARVLTQMYDRCIRDSGLEAPQFALMMTLARQGPTSQAAIGRRYGIDKTTLSRNLKLLQRKGWIASAVGRDKRVRLFDLTSAGRERLDAAKPRWKAAQDRLRAEMTAAEWSSMFRSFRTAAAAAVSAHRRLEPGGESRR